jgi:hypothetical protein
MSEFLVEVDDAELADAAGLLGTTSSEETIVSALRDVAVRARRGAAVERLGKMGEAGDFDILLDKRNYRPV